MKRIPRKSTSVLKINKAILGDSIEMTMERLMNGEGIDNIEDRDLVYNDNETGLVNPITNIRSDKMELMLEEKIGEYEHRHKKAPKVEVEKDDVNIEE